MDDATARKTQDEIIKAIEDLLGKKIDSRPEHQPINRICIDNVLLIATDYDFFLMEEDGRLEEELIKTYNGLGKDRIPKITHVIEENAINIITNQTFDAVIIFNPGNIDEAKVLGIEIKQKNKLIPIILIGKNTSQINNMVRKSNQHPIDWIFTWAGDGTVVIDIILFIENIMNSDNDNYAQWILICSDIPEHYSRLLYATSRVINKHMGEVLEEDLSVDQRKRRIDRRPGIRIIRNQEEMDAIYGRFSQHPLCILIDGINGQFSKIEKEDFRKMCKKSLCLMLLENVLKGTIERDFDNHILYFNKPSFNESFNSFIEKALGLSKIQYVDPINEKTTEIKNMKTLEANLWNIEEKILTDLIKDGKILNWLESRYEFEMALEINKIIAEENEIDIIRDKIRKKIEEYRKKSHMGSIMKYTRKTYGKHQRFSRIGNGAMGGKARGLAFMEKMISSYISEDTIPKIRITIPRTIVLCSDVFDEFLKINKILEDDLLNLPDDRIAVRFMEADLPATVLGDLRSFVRDTKEPLVIRSSSLMEDALHHPFAGIYASLLLSNESWEADIRFRELCTAIKYVFASVFFQRARTYMSTINKSSQEEKMPVIIQELVGKKHGNVFYPTLSGVAKSFDYYPTQSCDSADGVVNLVLGLGKAVVEGGNAYRFCPIHPKKPKYGSMKDLLNQSQREFFAVDLTTYTNLVKRDEDSTIKKYSIDKAELHGEMTQVASTYNPNNDRLNPGIGCDGYRVIDFGPILKLDMIPLPTALNLLLRICEIAIGTPVEIEFAMNIYEEKRTSGELYLLQVRSMFISDSDERITLENQDEQSILVYTNSALGNGVVKGIKDIIYVKPDNYELSQNPRIVPQIRELNRKMIDDNTRYILIGPGRWGSSDPWLGIPVEWSDISGAKTIVETPVEERSIDPSQGAHFFHNMVAAKTSYFTLTQANSGIIDWKFMEDIPALEEMDNIRHIHFDTPIEIQIDGKNGEGLILKPKTGDR